MRNIEIKARLNNMEDAKRIASTITEGIPPIRLKQSPTELKELLSSVLGIKVVVKKKRTVFFFQNVRIHLDRVEELGTFLEFEEVLVEGSLQPGDDDLIKQLMRKFSVEKEDLIEESYCELIAGKRSTSFG
jgi:predicted adenylyl cyclase CyaB